MIARCPLAVNAAPTGQPPASASYGLPRLRLAGQNVRGDGALQVPSNGGSAFQVLVFAVDPHWVPIACFSTILPQAEEGKNRTDDDHKSDNINDRIHWFSSWSPRGNVERRRRFQC